MISKWNLGDFRHSFTADGTLRQGELTHILKRVATIGIDGFKARRLNALLRGRRLKVKDNRYELKNAVRGHYLVSSEKGVYQVRGRFIHPVFPFHTFGLSIDGDRFYAAVSLGDWSYIISAYVHASGDRAVTLSDFRSLGMIEARYHNERTHQIHARAGRLAIANTRANSILLLEAETGHPILGIYPICDATGFPVTTDNNHINSVYQAGDVLFFTAHNAGKIGSFLGYVHADRVTAFGFPNRGVHDIIPTERGLVFSDTFGSSLKAFKCGGNLFVDGRGILPAGEERGFMVRGVAGTEDELIVGHSHHGRREDRFKANGALLILKDSRLQSVSETPFSQVYDVIRIDGHKMDDECDVLDAGTARSMLAKAVGGVAYESGYHVLRPGGGDFAVGTGF